MARFERRVPKHPTDCDQTLEAILEEIKLRNENDDKLVTFFIEADSIRLVYEG